MLPSLHRQSSFNIYIGEGSIEKGLLSRKSLLNATATVSGRTLLRLAKEVLCNCKKMMALVMARDSPYMDGSFPFGTYWDDYGKWCPVAFYRSEISGVYRADSASTMNSSTTSTCNDRYQMDPGTPGDAGQHDITAPTLGEDNGGTTSETLEQGGEERSNDAGGTVPVGYFFKGFLAWSLWGLIPVVESSSTTIKSTLFGDAKVDTHFGKRISRLKRAGSSVNLDEEVPMHHHKKATTTAGKNTTSVEPRNDTAASNNEKQLTELLSKSLALLERQAVEKERQKNNFLKERILRDKLAALSRKQNLLSQRYSTMLNRQPVDSTALQAIEKLLDDLESQVGDLEVELTLLQDAEVQRRSQALANHDD